MIRKSSKRYGEKHLASGYKLEKITKEFKDNNMKSLQTGLV